MLNRHENLQCELCDATDRPLHGWLSLLLCGECKDNMLLWLRCFIKADAVLFSPGEDDPVFDPTDNTPENRRAALIAGLRRLIVENLPGTVNWRLDLHREELKSHHERTERIMMRREREREMETEK